MSRFLIICTIEPDVFIRLPPARPGKKRAISPMVMVVSELRPDSCVVAEVRPSPNHSERKNGMMPDMIVLHYTGTRDTEAAIGQLCNPKSEVSAHYVVLQDGCILQLVPESRRAWHAGVSSWAGEADVNSRSIGIEIANAGHEHGYPDFPRRQIAAVTALCRSILTRHDVPADRVLAHSDVAPARKVDPGEKFPWKLLAASGIGLWVKPVPLVPGGPIYVLGETDPAIEEAQRLLARYGYGVVATGYMDGTTRDAVAAFQRHFRPMRVDGVLDASTTATLRGLIAERDARFASLQAS